MVFLRQLRYPWAVRTWWLLAIGACACGAPSPPAAPEPCPPAGAEDQASGGRAVGLDSLTQALVEAGHSCALSEEQVPVCDKGIAGRASFAVVFGAPLAFFVSSFRLKADQSCDGLAPLLNRLNAKADGIKVTCEEGRAAFVTSFILPEDGLPSEAVAGHAQRYQGLIQLMLREGNLVAHLE